jgi:hypothetical protein
MSTESSLWDLIVGIQTVITADPRLADLIQSRVYTGKVPGRAPLDYITITVPTESPTRLFARQGNTGTLQLTIRAASFERVVTIYRELLRVVDSQPIPVPGWCASLDCELMPIMSDPDDTAIFAGPVRAHYTTYPSS